MGASRELRQLARSFGMLPLEHFRHQLGYMIVIAQAKEFGGPDVGPTCR